jgi:hypothetical protein
MGRRRVGLWGQLDMLEAVDDSGGAGAPNLSARKRRYGNVSQQPSRNV